MVHPKKTRPVFETARILVGIAMETDAQLFQELWNDPRVMGFVGFPDGLSISLDEVVIQIRNWNLNRNQRQRAIDQESDSDSGLDRLLIAVEKSTCQSIGECMAHRPDGEGIARTDIKLLPRFWGQGYGIELKRGLLHHLFSRTDCRAVEATPNVNNLASIRMQESAGGVLIGEAVFTFPESSAKLRTAPVHHFIYRVYRLFSQDLPVSNE